MAQFHVGSILNDFQVGIFTAWPFAVAQIHYALKHGARPDWC
jgi:hypothetical protein